MTIQLPLWVRHVMYNLRGGFLVRPLTIAVALGCTGALLSWIEETVPGAADWVPRALFPSHADPQVATTLKQIGNDHTVAIVVAPWHVHPAWPLSGSTAGHRSGTGMHRGPSILDRGNRARRCRLGATRALSISCRPSGCASHSCGNRRIHHDGGFDRFRDPPDDAHIGFHAVLPTYHRQLCTGWRDPMRSEERRVGTER